jgi:hypothetical protein
MINPITNLKIQPSEQSLVIDWDASTSPSITKYALAFSTDNFSTFGNNAPNFNNSEYTEVNADITAYRLTSLTNSTTYYVSIIAKTATEQSNQVISSAIPGRVAQKYGQVKYGRAFYRYDTIPDAPVNVQVSISGKRKLTLNWQLPNTGQYIDIDNIHIWRQKNSEPFNIIATVAASATSYIDTNIQTGNYYNYKVTTIDWQ